MNPSEIWHSFFGHSQQPSTTCNVLPTWTPLADVFEGPDNLTFLVYLPGVGAENILISRTSRVITVSGFRLNQHSGQNAIQFEGLYGSFTRAFSVATDVCWKSIACSFTDGILAVTVDKIKKIA